MKAELIRVHTESLERQVMAEVNPGSYDLKIVNDVLVLSIYGDWGIETVFQAYHLDDGGNLASDKPEDAYSRFGLPNGYDNGTRFLINPWFSTEYFGYSCYAQTVVQAGIKIVYLKKTNQQPAEEIIACGGEPLLSGDKIFYRDTDGKNLLQCALDGLQETVLYEIPADNSVTLMTFDAEWLYFSQTYYAGEGSTSSRSVMRVNLQDKRTEEIYQLQTGDSISNFNVYGDNCYFILEGADGNQWQRCNLTDFSVTDGEESMTDKTDIYDDVLAQYKDMVRNDFYWDLLLTDSYDSSFGKDIGLEIRARKQNVFYAFHDIDGNGTMELIIAGGEEDKGVDRSDFELRNYDLYGYDGNSVVHIFPTDFGGRTNFSLCENGVIKIGSAGTRGEYRVDLYRIGDDGFTPELIESSYATTYSEGDELTTSEFDWVQIY